MLSDADFYLQENIARHHLHFDAVVSSQQLGCYKPHRHVFAEACRILGFEPAATIYVGDGPETDVEGARRAGMRTVWVDRGATPWPAVLAPPDATITSLREMSKVIADLTCRSSSRGAPGRP